MGNADSDRQSVQSVYAERFAADLATNRSEQGEIAARISELEARLEQLRMDEGWLTGMQGKVPAAAPAARPVSAPATGSAAPGAEPQAATAVPQPRPATGTDATPPALKGAGRKRAAAGRSAAAPKAAKKTGGSAAVKKSAASDVAPAAEAPLLQLVRALLPVGEPRLVREVHADLEKAHPSRKTSTQVVRNTLETLVKRGVISKGNQKGSVLYTAPEPAAETEPAEPGMASAGA
ncbi:hypothetical protein OG782_36040 [Streptomyces sp. NBC_00876]|uniref:hypothetical protein n=1 Tax=Streptomyces sp. NBC_00876 TaxID=2975853 RepID=UPI003867552A|nr:hypothetical protein OG782_36040 [Streptomyces sp. NBC_00876]